MRHSYSKDPLDDTGLVQTGAPEQMSDGAPSSWSYWSWDSWGLPKLVGVLRLAVSRGWYLSEFSDYFVSAEQQTPTAWVAATSWGGATSCDVDSSGNAVLTLVDHFKVGGPPPVKVKFNVFDNIELPEAWKDLMVRLYMSKKLKDWQASLLVEVEALGQFPLATLAPLSVDQLKAWLRPILAPFNVCAGYEAILVDCLEPLKPHIRVSMFHNGQWAVSVRLLDADDQLCWLRIARLTWNPAKWSAGTLRELEHVGKQLLIEALGFTGSRVIGGMSIARAPGSEPVASSWLDPVNHSFICHDVDPVKLHMKLANVVKQKLSSPTTLESDLAAVYEFCRAEASVLASC